MALRSRRVMHDTILLVNEKIDSVDPFFLRLEHEMRRPPLSERIRVRQGEAAVYIHYAADVHWLEDVRDCTGRAHRVQDGYGRMRRVVEVLATFVGQVRDCHDEICLRESVHVLESGVFAEPSQ